MPWLPSWATEAGTGARSRVHSNEMLPPDGTLQLDDVVHRSKPCANRAAESCCKGGRQNLIS